MLKKGLFISLQIAFLLCISSSFPVWMYAFFFFTLCLKFISFPQLGLNINLFCFSLVLSKTFDTTKSFLCLETFLAIIVSLLAFTLFFGYSPCCSYFTLQFCISFPLLWVSVVVLHFGWWSLSWYSITLLPLGFCIWPSCLSSSFRVLWFEKFVFFRFIDVCEFSHFSHVRLCDPMDCQAPLSMGLSQQEYSSGLPFLPPL